MSRQQLPLALRAPRRPRFDNFVAGSNQATVELLAQGLESGNWYFLAGPAGSGRSHLLSATFTDRLGRGETALFLALSLPANVGLLDQACADCILLDDIDALAGQDEAEIRLFNALNRWRAERSTVLMSGASRQGFTLPDLRSRLGQAARLTIKPLEEPDLRTLIARLAAEYEVLLGRGAADYLLTRGARSAASIARLIEQLSSRALTERRTLSVPMIREALKAD
ncbi:MAG: hypothetical protein JJU31_03370 [Wenzhouxiangella sp.]|nr:hypothetical protein [Wenzhouxiangella sp.]MCH8477511.1 hypothetical protein [Wenzhouxiangella sp.]TVR93692.1 MAG: hypothetical protein EA418_11720 [Wenzhouxiangellaceae bacterium]